VETSQRSECGPMLQTTDLLESVALFIVGKDHLSEQHSLLTGVFDWGDPVFNFMPWIPPNSKISK